jgi:drug/metabolite transporter (DMT)-like permease
MKDRNKSLIQVHSAVLLFGITGLFGKFLLLPAMIIVLGRVFFSSVFLIFANLYLKNSIRLKVRRHYYFLIIMGVILAVHWSTFFHAIQISTVAIGLLTFATFPVYVTFLEPYFFKEQLKLSSILVSLITLAGVAIVVPSFELDNHMTQGILWGILSAFLFAFISILNKKYVSEYPSQVITLYEHGVATITLIPALFLYDVSFRPEDVLLLAILGVIFTGISHALFISGLKHIKSRTGSIIACLEVVYGILFAALFLGEMPGARDLIGGIIILAAAFYVTVKSK